jgi:hypothetical protein
MRKFSTFRNTAIGAAALASLPLAGASATITFDGDPGPALPGNEELVIFEKPASLTPATSQTGDTNRTQTPVIFDTNFTAGAGSLGGSGLGQFIVSTGLGHSTLACVPPGTNGVPSTAPACGTDGTGGANGMQLQSIEIMPAPGTAWGDMLANLDFGEGTANIYAHDDLGNNFTFTLGNGQNKFNLIASAGEVITDVQITMLTGSSTPFGWNDLKEVDISGACTLNGTVCTLIPEPTSLVLLASGLLGLGFVYRRRRA